MCGAIMCGAMTYGATNDAYKRVETASRDDMQRSDAQGACERRDEVKLPCMVRRR